MEEQDKKIKIKRIGGYLHKVIPIVNIAGKVLSYTLKPLMVELRLRDLLQIIVGSSILAIPLSFTEEAWKLGETLPFLNVFALLILTILFISLFIYFNFYRFNFKGNSFRYIKRVLATYILSLIVVGLILTIIQKCPWGVNNMVAIKRIIIIAFPASMSATVSDSLK